ncbi:methyltransferase [Sphingobacterium sp. SGG-5]|uniref:tRNA1(Val) (adenine(37)-N6)-methyltransferase n=1 Tax=Sphingobacterium sp. SGG-5 TaxID=2710881 RepID=UPI0013E9D3FE|nr:methyltransferase [Sphingobacterium sp. SGG-5]NGM62913.1 methyltransferase [Sphingobacterium sp. SGG-5]
MAKSTFQFKQFNVEQAGCAMKINTDGVLLGAMVSHDDPQEILDIGTGTGVIALMLAQRFPFAKIDAVEIDTQAAHQAGINFQNSTFSNRINVFNSSFEVIGEDSRYDLIVSNPPFYINSLHAPNERKKVAKHTDIHFFKSMLNFAYCRLQDGGMLQLILPTELSVEIKQEALKHKLYPTQEIAIRSFENTRALRQILFFQKDIPPILPHQQNFVIYADKGIYSDEYRQLLKPFFLAF